MTNQIDPGSYGADDQQAERWIATLRDGSPTEKAAARRGLAAIFEARGMVAESIDLLLTNAREGYRDVELFQALARLYRAHGDEYLAASAALEATRLSGRRHEPGHRSDHGALVHGDRASSRAPWGQDETPRPSGTRAEGQQAGPRPGGREDDSAPAREHAAWRRPVRIAGWLAVVVTVLAALGVSSTSAASAGVYLVSAAALGLLLSGSLSARRRLRLPAGPLGDGALLFAWLLLLLAAGAILPRGPGVMGGFGQPEVIPTPSLYRTPAPPTVPASPTVAR